MSLVNLLVEKILTVCIVIYHLFHVNCS